jgi:hypothetical protein
VPTARTTAPGEPVLHRPLPRPSPSYDGFYRLMCAAKPQDAQSKSVREKTIQWYENTLLSRLDDKVHGAIVVVRQRLRMDDLSGHLLEKNAGFELLCLPAIAEIRQTIQLPHGRVHVREIDDDVLDPVREPRVALEDPKTSMTPLVFSAQYQQAPIPHAGNLIKREWLRFYTGNLPWQENEYYVVSWDTAMKSSERADYSVGAVWLVHDKASSCGERWCTIFFGSMFCAVCGLVARKSMCVRTKMLDP